MRLVFLAFLTLIVFVNHTEAWKHFWRGKWIQKRIGKSLVENGPPEQWFEQKLDHSDVINSKTWKQVRKYPYTYYINDLFWY